MSRFGGLLRIRRFPLPRLTLSAVIVLTLALPLLAVATQFLEQVQRFATWSPLQLMALFAALLAAKVVVLLSLGRMLRRHAE